jgi:hypothetical protein
MSTPTSSNGINTSATHEASLKNNQIGSPADGRRLNGSGSLGSDVTSGMEAQQNAEVRPVMVRPVDRKTIEGSYAGDSRENESQDFSTDGLKHQAGPRGETGTKGA